MQRAETTSRLPLISAAIAFALYAVVVILMLERRGWDPSTFVVAGEAFTERSSAPPQLHVSPDAGYDGQFYFRLALHPFSTAATEAGVHFDYPVYRHQRILYPLIVRTFGGGAAVPTFWILMAVNLAAVTFMAWTASRVVAFAGVHPLFGLAVPMYAGFLLTISRDLCEILEVALIVAAIDALQRSRHLRGALLLSLAGLAKEPAIAFAAGPLVVAAFVIVKSRRFDARLLFAIPPLVHLLWKKALFSAWNIEPSLSVDPFSLPLTSYVAAFKSSANGSVLQIELLLLAAIFVIALIGFATSRLALEVRLGWIAFAAIAVSLGGGFWMEDWAFLRSVAEFAAVGLLLAVTGARWLRAAAIAFAGSTWVLMLAVVLSR